MELDEVDAARAATLAHLPSVLSTDEWDVLFDAVRVRLRLVVEEGLAAAAGRDAPDAVVGLALPNVLECLDALDLLHAMPAAGRSRRHGR
jgi:hypothetical protein